MNEAQERSAPPEYRGRFAPTPSGPLHLGSLLAALAGWLDARSQGGAWLLRIDDLDPQRSIPAAADRILAQLEAHGLTWDESPRRQSEHLDEYAAWLERLAQRASLYPCYCTRAVLNRESLPGPDGPVYAGTCSGREPSTAPHSLRLRLDEGESVLDDRFLGMVRRNQRLEIGDFVVRRADGVPGYPLVSVVDDAAMRITDVIRGHDLLGSSLRQTCLRRLIDLTAVRHGHVPTLTDRTGRKLSKQNHAAPLDDAAAPASLLHCLRYLGQRPPDELEDAPVETILNWAQAHWQPRSLPRQHALPVED
jgi:glutamyl-Q tRNA(Asp) synthetase